MSTAEEVTVLVSDKISLYSAEPILNTLLDRGVRVFLACPEALSAFAVEKFPGVSGRIVVLDRLVERTRHLARWHHRLRWLATDMNVSVQYRQQLESRRGARRARAAMLGRRLVQGLPKYPVNRVNHLLRTLVSPWLPNPFPTKRVVAISIPVVPHLLCAQEVEVVTVMESWDHPCKRPFGYPSHKSILWNESLAADWERFQGRGRTVVGYPLKLRYALEMSAGRGSDRRDGEPRTAMYPASTSATTHYAGWQEDEAKIIEDLCVATGRAGWRLLIKPKPNGQSGEYDDFARRFDHVAVGTYRDASVPTDYYLDDAYNERRFKELQACDLVINLGTTFALDAAIAGVPVMQLDIRGNVHYPSLAKACTNYHIEQYFLSDPSRTYPVVGEQRVSDVVGGWLQGDLARTRAFTAGLRDWLRPRRSLVDSLQAIADEIVL